MLGNVAARPGACHDRTGGHDTAPDPLRHQGVIAEGCVLDVQAVLEGLGADAPATEAVIGSPEAALLERNEVGRVRLPAPVLLVTGGEDDLFTPEIAAAEVAAMCALGTSVETLHLPEATHSQLSSAARAPALRWLLDVSTEAETACEDG